MRLRFPALRPRHKRELRHWAIELAVVVVGVLLALFAAEWAEERRHEERRALTLERIDDLAGRAMAISAVRVSTNACLRNRLASLDTALRKDDDQWKAMPLANVPARMQGMSPFPVVYVADTADLPVELFVVAEDQGVFANLPAIRHDLYVGVRQDVLWIDHNWKDTAAGPELSLLGIDGPLDARGRHEMRRELVDLGVENQIALVRARSLAERMQKAGIELSEANRRPYSEVPVPLRRMNAGLRLACPNTPAAF